MNVKKVDIVVGGCSVVLSACGILCVIVGNILNYFHGESYAVYRTQNWLGFPLLLVGMISIFFVMRCTNKNLKQVVFMFCAYTLVIILAFVASILHGASYVNMGTNEAASLVNLGYVCVYKPGSNLCECVNKEAKDKHYYSSYFCSDITPVLQFHLAMFCVAVISYGTLLLLLFIIIFMLNWLSNQADGSPNNVNCVENREATVVENDHLPSLVQQEVHRDPPPPYDSLLATFHRNQEQFGNISDHGPNRRPHVVNHNARVSYRGETSIEAGASAGSLINIGRQATFNEITSNRENNSVQIHINMDEMSTNDETVNVSHDRLGRDDENRPEIDGNNSSEDSDVNDRVVTESTDAQVVSYFHGTRSESSLPESQYSSDLSNHESAERLQEFNETLRHDLTSAHESDETRSIENQTSQENNSANLISNTLEHVADIDRCEIDNDLVGSHILTH